MHRGQRRKFSTGESSIAAARKKASAIMADVKSRGLEEAIKMHARRAHRRSSDPTIDEFGEIFRETMSRIETPPSKPSIEYYIRSLRIVCERGGVIRIRQLNRTKIAHFIKLYRKAALNEGRDQGSVKISINSYLRNAAAMFSKAALEEYREIGLELQNPFFGARLRGVKLKGYTPLNAETLNRIWRDAVLLRDGDPKSTKTASTKRWGSFDFRRPHPESYLLLLLELGLGLRRHEADKAQWDWLISDSKGRIFLEVRSTKYFIPKGRERRVIPVEADLYHALVALKADETFIVPGRMPRCYPVGKEPKNLTYRCERHHRALANWLRSRGLTDAKPCHQLRKEFGSYVATSFGLFHAQKFLGHSTPAVTEAYYASLVALPELKTVRLYTS